MTKLTNVVPGFGPFSARRPLAAAKSFRVVLPLPRPVLVARRGLQCGWAVDGTGHLACNWSEIVGADSAPGEDACMLRRGFDRAGFLLAA